MSRAIFFRLIWKEHRTYRTLWFTILAVTLLLQVLVMLTGVWSGQVGVGEQRDLLYLALGMPITFAIAVSAVGYSQEHESGTYGYLRSLPTRGVHILTARTVYCLSAAIAMTVVLLLLFLIALPVVAGGVSTHIAEQITPTLIRSEMPLLLYCAVLIVGSISCGTFFSLITRKPLRAALLTALFVFMLQLGPRVFLVSIAVLVPIDLILVSRWFEGRPSRSPAMTSSSSRMRLALGDWGSLFSRSAGRLTWLQSRFLWPVYLAYIVLVSLATFGLMLETVNSLMLGILCVQVLATLLGLSVFYVDHQQHSYRFLAEHGISPRELWVVRHAPGLILVAFTCGLLYFVMGAGHDFGMVPDLSAMASLPLLAYMGGQYCTLMTRSAIVAAFIALSLTAITTAWCALTWILQIPWWVAVAPFAVLLLLASYIRLPNWILERDGWREMVLPLVVPFVAGAVSALGAASFRVLEVPQLSVEQRQSLVASPFDVPNASPLQPFLLRAVDNAPKVPHIDALPPSVANELRFDGADEFRWSSLPLPASDLETQWVTDGEYSLAQLQEAVSGDGQVVPLDDSRPPTLDLTSLNRLVLADARRLTDEGDLAAAWQQLQTSLQLATQLRLASGTLWASLVADAMEDAAYGRLLWWAASDDQSVANLRDAIAMVSKMSDSQEACGQRFRRETALNRDMIELAPESLEELGLGDPSIQRVAFVYRLMPWERERSLRSFDYLSYVQLLLIDADDLLVKNGEALAPVLARRANVVHYDTAFYRSLLIPELFVSGVSIEQVFAKVENRRRVMICQLALLAWRLEHGSYPESLEQAATFLDLKLKSDVYTGRPFVYLSEGVDCRIWVQYQTLFDELAVPYSRQHPFVWSPGEKLNVVGVSPLTPRDYKYYDFFPEYRRRGEAGLNDAWGVAGLNDATREEIVWQSGIIYGLPERSE